VDLNSRSDAVRNAVWSVAVQHGGAATIVSQAVGDTDRAMARTDARYDQALIDNIYDRRIGYVAREREKRLLRLRNFRTHLTRRSRKSGKIFSSKRPRSGDRVEYSRIERSFAGGQLEERS
jgi:hypothetical protein